MEFCYELLKRWLMTYYGCLSNFAIQPQVEKLTPMKIMYAIHFKDRLLDTFIKTLISCKNKPIKTVIVACYPLMKTVNHDQFKTTLLPALQKAMLRNPEIIIECVGFVISGVDLDLSLYASDIGKSLIGKHYCSSSMEPVKYRCLCVS